MTRPIIPPRGIFVSSKLLFDKSIPHAVRDTAIQLSAIAWGRPETPPVSIHEISELTGKSVPTLYSHMGLLRDRGALRWRPAGTSTIIVMLLDGLFPLTEPDISSSDSKNLELPVNSISIPIDSTIDKENTSSSENLEIPENEKTASSSGTNAIKEKYCQLLGYVPDGWSAGEGSAAKAIGAKYTVDEFELVYHHMKAQKFWADKHLMLRQIKPQMQGVLAYLRKNGNYAVIKSTYADDAGARECAEQINSRNGRA